MYILAVNCGSSSIKGKLYTIPSSPSEPLLPLASLGVSNISSKGEKVKISVDWEDSKGKDVDEEGEDGATVECRSTMKKQFQDVMLMTQMSRCSQFCLRS